VKTPAPRRASLPLLSGMTVAPTAIVAPSPDRRHYRRLDAYRSIAVLASVVFTVYQFCNVNHALEHGFFYHLINSLDAAVPCLFVITGFLIFEPVARHTIDGDLPRADRSYFTRRALRLVPLYFIVVLVVWFFRQQNLPGDWHDLLEHLTFTQVFDPKRIFYTDGPAWAVSVLAYFYLTLGLVSTALARISPHLASRQHRFALVCTAPALLTAVSLLWKTWSIAAQHRTPGGSSTTWYGPLANLDNFAIGMAVAAIAAAIGNAPPAPTRTRVGLRIAAAAILTLAFFAQSADNWPAAYFSIICSLGFGFLIAAAVLEPVTQSRRQRTTWSFTPAIAAAAYGIYLWHEPILLAVNNWGGLVRQTPDAFLQDTAVVLVLSIAAGWVSYLLIQRPINQLLKIFLPRHRTRSLIQKPNLTR
jgi:peptidoglycan/LPS O-acetylase OafA/YrhL